MRPNRAPGLESRLTAARLLAAALVFSAGALGAQAQVVRLPSVVPADPALVAQAPSGMVPLYSTGPSRTFATAYESSPAEPEVSQQSTIAPPPLPKGAKPGALQQVSLTDTWIPRGSTDLGLNTIALQAIVGLPFPARDAPTVLTPEFDVTFVDGPTVPDLPARLYDASLQIRHLRKLTPRLGMDIGIAPGWHGDYKQDDAQTFRIPGRAVGAFDWTPITQLVFGVAYLDREDVSFLPIAGVIYTPNDDTRIEAIFPRPKLAWRFQNDGVVEHWAYLAGEFGGGSYAIERASGAQDVITLSDVRLLAGLERKVAGGFSARYEIGYVFDRKIEYLSGTPEVDPGDTALVRASLWY